MIRNAVADKRAPELSAADLLPAILSRADCAALTPGEAVLTAVVPVEWLDDAFAIIGASEDLEDGHDRERDLSDLEPDSDGETPAAPFVMDQTDGWGRG